MYAEHAPVEIDAPRRNYISEDYLDGLTFNTIYDCNIRETILSIVQLLRYWFVACGFCGRPYAA